MRLRSVRFKKPVAMWSAIDGANATQCLRYLMTNYGCYLQRAITDPSRGVWIARYE